MSKGLTCDVCRKTSIVSNFDLATLPEGFDGWLHLGVSKRLGEDPQYPKLPLDKLKYHEVDICPECVKKIDTVQKNCMASANTKCMFDLVGRIMAG